jgi:hypothetical protein
MPEERSKGGATEVARKTEGLGDTALPAAAQAAIKSLIA